MATLRIFGKAHAPKPIQVSGPRYLPYDGLREKGICYSKTYLKRLYESGRFPKPTKLSARRMVWRESDVDAWLDEKEKESAGESA